MLQHYRLASLICFVALPVSTCYLYWMLKGDRQPMDDLNLSIHSIDSQHIMETLRSIMNDCQLRVKSIHTGAVANLQMPLAQVELDFSTTYDGNAYQFLELLLQKYPGKIVIKTLKLERIKQNPQSQLTQMDKAALSDLIIGYIQLYCVLPL